MKRLSVISILLILAGFIIIICNSIAGIIPLLTGIILLSIHLTKSNKIPNTNDLGPGYELEFRELSDDKAKSRNNKLDNLLNN